MSDCLKSIYRKTARDTLLAGEKNRRIPPQKDTERMKNLRKEIIKFSNFGTFPAGHQHRYMITVQ
uniref:Uncharacterized protein n=1 Tax=Romanomermis culicivorax TaxID=13658 RepID=A0A915HLG5_ROMCU